MWYLHKWDVGVGQYYESFPLNRYINIRGNEININKKETEQGTGSIQEKDRDKGKQKFV
jgi:hypothetical protein